MSIKTVPNQLVSQALTIPRTYFGSNPKYVPTWQQVRTPREENQRMAHFFAETRPQRLRFQTTNFSGVTLSLKQMREKNERHNTLFHFYVISTHQVPNHFPTTLRSLRLWRQNYTPQTVPANGDEIHTVCKYKSSCGCDVRAGGSIIQC